MVDHWTNPQSGNNSKVEIRDWTATIRYNAGMGLFDRIVEERIQRAQEEGVFDNLPGRGKPLVLDDDGTVPEDLRLTYKVLKNSNCLPVEMEMRKELFNLRQ